MRQILFIASFFLIIAGANGQDSFGVIVEGGVSKLHKTKARHGYMPANLPDYSFSDKPVFTPRIGVYLNIKIVKKILMGTKLFYTSGGSDFSYSETGVYTNGTYSVTITDYFNEVQKTRSWGLNQYFEYRHRIVAFNLGFQFLRTSRISGYAERAQSENGGDPHVYIQANYLHENLSKIDYGFTAGILCYLNSRISITGNFYYGLNYPEYLVDKYILKSTQLTLGFRFALWIPKDEVNKTE